VSAPQQRLDPTVRVTLPAGPEGPGEARRVVARCAREHGFDGDDLALVVTELVTNAVRHGAPPVELEIGTGTQTVTVVVADGGPGGPVPRDAGVDDEGGRGLLLVEGLSADSGVQARPPGKAVWAELPRTAGPPGPS
jgi:anti-sigma regulatory factor (Ser/Thr protein kinase)